MKFLTLKPKNAIIKLSKTVNGVTTTYYLNGSQILGEETNGNVTLYVYDASGSPIGMQYHGANYADGVWDVYWYEKNIFGDIIAVYDEEGTKLASYVYDAWGNPNQTEHNGGFEPATINPFRYRGYYYDVHLRFYYLNTRYYDPYGYRFLSPDSYVSTGQGILSYNMYAYCNNNPVMNVDPNGDLSEKFENSFFYQVIIKNLTVSGGITYGFKVPIELGHRLSAELDNSIDIVGFRLDDGKWHWGHPATCTGSVSYSVTEFIDLTYSYGLDSYESFDGHRESDDDFENDLSLSWGMGAAVLLGAHLDVSFSLSGFAKSIREFFSK